MSYQQLTQRLLSSAVNISTQQMSAGHVSDGDFNRLVGTAGDISDLPLYIDDTPALSINALRTRARRMKRQHGIGLIVVDYLQLMTAPSSRNDLNRVQEISAISQGLKQVARELDVPVLAASQLSRNVESRDNKRPQLADLRDSGSIEQDADICLFLYRADYYLSRQLGAADESMISDPREREKLQHAKQTLEAVKGVTELIVGKNRKGPTDTVRLLFNPQTTIFHNYSPR
jgi:replicative DNA helicase